MALLLPLSQAAAQQPDAAQILEKSRELSITSSLNAKLHLAITEKSGAMRRRTISMLSKSYPGGTEKRLIRFIEPADVKGTAMLVVDNKNTADEMWIYLPALKKTRRIVSSEKGKSFMSSEFSNADMSSPAPSDFKSRHLDRSGQNGQWIIESIPADDKKADEYGYLKKISYIRVSDHQVMKMEFYNFDNVLFKTIEIKNIQNLSGGKFLIQDMVSENLITKRKSEIHFSEINEGSKIDDSLFSLQNLER